jgi:hypothetical protein
MLFVLLNLYFYLLTTTFIFLLLFSFSSHFTLFLTPSSFFSSHFSVLFSSHSRSDFLADGADAEDLLRKAKSEKKEGEGGDENW